VRSVDARRHLAYERGARDGRDGHGGLRIPEVVDSERPVARSDLRDDPGHHRDAFERRLELVRTVALVAEEDCVESRASQDLDVPANGLDDRVGPSPLVVQRRPRQRRQVRHCDDRLLDAEVVFQLERHSHIPFNTRRMEPSGPGSRTTAALAGRIVSIVSDRPTIKDVAERAGVSIATVSRALNDKGDVSVETRERVREAARSVDYSADPAARSLASQKTRLVAVVVGDNAGHRDLSLVFFGKVLAAISRRLGQSSYDPLLLQPG